MLRITAVLALLGLWWAPASKSIALESSRIETLALGVYERTGQPTLAIRVAGPWGATTFSRGKDGSAPPNARTTFVIGSVSKSLTATAVLQLRDQGKLDLNAPVERYLPAIKFQDRRFARVSVRQLLLHRSGIPTAAGLTEPGRGESAPTAVTRAASTLATVKLTAAPGSITHYSSANYLLLGAIVERLSNQPFGDYVERRVMKPLGMADSAASARRLDAAQVIPGRQPVLWFSRAVAYQPFPAGAPYGYMISTLDDLSTYAQWVLRGDGSHIALTDRSMRELQTAQAPGSGPLGYSYGWRVGELDGKGPAVTEHTGATPGTFAHVLVLPQQRTTIVVVAATYSEALAPTLAGLGYDLAREVGGGTAAEDPPDPLLTLGHYTVSLFAVGWFVVAGWWLRRRARYRWQATMAVIAVLLAAGGWRAPALLGQTWPVLREWAPDWWIALLLWVGGATAMLLATVAASLNRRRLRTKTPVPEVCKR